ncbi:MAG: rRNA maturation RNase YbeY [Alphaproteobacteria bacterium]
MTDPVLDIDINTEAGDWSGRIARLEETTAIAARAAMSVCRVASERVELSVLLTDDARMAVLNENWRGKTGPTNVLSFPGDLDGPGPAMLGDIALALETVTAEAKAAGISVSDHFSHLVVHGMLHLLGYDHETDREALEMEGLETDILGTLGIDDPYAGGRPELTGVAS